MTALDQQTHVKTSKAFYSAWVQKNNLHCKNIKVMNEMILIHFII